MGEWKQAVTLRILPVLRVELMQCAVRERRSLGNTGATLLEWAIEQLRTAGSIERLLKVQLTNKKANG